MCTHGSARTMPVTLSLSLDRSSCRDREEGPDWARLVGGGGGMVVPRSSFSSAGHAVQVAGTCHATAATHCSHLRGPGERCILIPACKVAAVAGSGISLDRMQAAVQSDG